MIKGEVVRAPTSATKPIETTSPDRIAVSVPIVATSLSLAYAGIAAVTLFHQFEGEHEAAEPPFLVHVLRDGTLALPLVFMVVVAVVALLGRIARARNLSPIAVAVVLGVASALALAFAAPIHELLFEAGEEHQEHSTLVHFAINTGYALVGTLPAAIVVLLIAPALRGRSDRRVLDVTS